jgi:hypothetical protein
MLARTVNIADVPFPFGSGGEKDELLSVQKVDTVVPISPDNFQEGLWKLITFSTHSSPP